MRVPKRRAGVSRHVGLRPRTWWYSRDVDGTLPAYDYHLRIHDIDPPRWCTTKSAHARTDTGGIRRFSIRLHEAIRRRRHPRRPARLLLRIDEKDALGQHLLIGRSVEQD